MSLLLFNPPASPAAGENPLPATTYRDIAYGKDSAQRMDIYLPAGRSLATTRSLVLIHGGGWNSGSKADFKSYIDSFQRRMPDYAIFNLNYRLFNGGHTFPAQEEDIKAALDFITSRAADYAINAKRIVLLGASAGGHLALLQAYKYNSPQIAGVIDFFGPTDLTTMYQHPWHPMVPFALQMVTGTTPSDNPVLYRQSSPVNFVSAQSPPTLIFHGGNDPVVNISQSEALKKKLQAAGVKNNLVVYPTQRHGWHGSTLSNSFDHIETFLKSAIH